MVEEEEIREIVGEIEGWAKDVRDFNRGGRGCRGIKINNEWHNLIGDMKELETIDQKFPKGTQIAFKEKKNNKGYWDIEGNITVEVRDKVPIEGTEKDFKPNVDPNVWVEKDKTIQMHVAFKAAIEEMKTAYATANEVDMNEFAKLTMEFTEKYYKSLNKLKLKLKENGEW